MYVQPLYLDTNINLLQKPTVDLKRPICNLTNKTNGQHLTIVHGSMNPRLNSIWLLEKELVFNVTFFFTFEGSQISQYLRSFFFFCDVEQGVTSTIATPMMMVKKPIYCCRLYPSVLHYSRMSLFSVCRIPMEIPMPGLRSNSAINHSCRLSNLRTNLHSYSDGLHDDDEIWEIFRRY